MIEIAGYAVKWREQANVNGAAERFAPGALADCLRRVGDRRHLVELREMHERPLILAHTADASLRLWETAVGLMFAADVPGALGAHLRELLDGGVYLGASIGFVALKSESTDGVRVVTTADLLELSIVDAPAYRTSQVFIR